MTIPFALNVAACFAWLAAPLAILPAQCDPVWLAGSPAGGPAGDVSALLRLPSGDLLGGGSFRFADAVEARNLARWDGTTWRAFGAGTDAEVTCLVQLANGDIVAGGRFTTMDGQPAARVARFDGNSWSQVGTGFNGAVLSLLPLPNGEFVAGGSFTIAGTTTVNRVARWDGTAWRALGMGFANSSVAALARRPNGDIVAAGNFLGATLSGVLRWDGATWNQVNGFEITSIANVESLATLPNGDLAIGGSFAIGGAPQSVAIWNGATMQPLSPPITIASPRLLAASNGDLVVAGSVATVGAVNVARWNGSAWSTIAGGPIAPKTLAEGANGGLVVGARTNVNGERSHAVAGFDGASWQVLGAALPPIVSEIVAMPNGDVIVGGDFSTFRGVSANCLARFDGAGWSPLGVGVDGHVRAMIATPSGDLIVTGDFENAGGGPAGHIARFDGANWSTLGVGIPEPAIALAIMPNGDVAALRGGSLYTFDGLAWSQRSVPGLLVGRALALVNASDLAIGGLFATGPAVDGGISVLSNGAFTAIPGAPTDVFQILPTASNALLVASAQGVQRFLGGTWSSVLGGAATALTRFPNGDLLVGGAPQVLPGSSASSALFRDEPGGFQGFASVDGGAVRKVLVTDRGEIFAAGSFSLVQGSVSAGFAEGRATCAAAVQSIGSGCTGGAGPVTLNARSRAWIGGTIRTVASGMAGGSLALQLVGSQPAALPLPGGAAGCTLFVQPASLYLLSPNAGLAEAAFAVPPIPNLVGQQFRLQVVGVESNQFGIVRLTSTNALSCTIGAL
ncbi:MAG: hypothetical protein AB8H80_17095 [Planctomycetota bacterium]